MSSTTKASKSSKSVKVEPVVSTDESIKLEEVVKVEPKVSKSSKAVKVEPVVSTEEVVKEPKVAKSSKAVKPVKVEPVVDVSVDEPVKVEEVIKKEPKVSKKQKEPKELSTETLQDNNEKNLSDVIETSLVKIAELENSATLESSSVELSHKFFKELQRILNELSKLKAEYRLVEKQVSKDLKTAIKTSSKRRRKTDDASISGFKKPTLITDELAIFIDKPIGTLISRADVTTEINKYINANNLKLAPDKRIIHFDDKLAVLLRLTKGVDHLEYFNLQKYLKIHFIKTVVPVENAVVADAV
jgi:chromatin remodeling complex protein RSC6